MKRIAAIMFSLCLCSGFAIADGGYDKLFDKLDANSDGQLSKKEFVEGKQHEVNRKKVVQLFPGFKDLAEVQENEYRSRLFDAMDTNKNGLLDKGEWNKTAPNILEIRFCNRS